MKNILDEARDLVYGERNHDYGHPYYDFRCQAEIITAYLKRKGVLAKGKSIEAADIPIFMQATKIAREANRHKRDNLVDGAGYWGTLERVIHKRDELEDGA